MKFAYTRTSFYPGNYTVKVDFEGSITRNMEGIYPCFFKDAKGQEQKLVPPNLKATTRAGFPRIDEPARQSRL